MGWGAGGKVEEGRRVVVADAQQGCAGAGGWRRQKKQSGNQDGVERSGGGAVAGQPVEQLRGIVVVGSFEVWPGGLVL